MCTLFKLKVITEESQEMVFKDRIPLYSKNTSGKPLKLF